MKAQSLKSKKSSQNSKFPVFYDIVLPQDNFYYPISYYKNKFEVRSWE